MVARIALFAGVALIVLQRTKSPSITLKLNGPTFGSVRDQPSSVDASIPDGRRYFTLYHSAPHSNHSCPRDQQHDPQGIGGHFETSFEDAVRLFP